MIAGGVIRRQLEALVVAIVTLACLSACAPRRYVPKVVGTRQDMRTTAGSYDGYSVVTHCRFATIGIVGHGKQWLENADPDDLRRGDAMGRFAEQVLPAMMAGMPSVHGFGGGGLACSGRGVSVHLSDWREVDAVIRALGALLRAGNLREEIGVYIAAPEVIL